MKILKRIVRDAVFAVPGGTRVLTIARTINFLVRYPRILFFPKKVLSIEQAPKPQAMPHPLSAEYSLLVHGIAVAQAGLGNSGQRRFAPRKYLRNVRWWQIALLSKSHAISRTIILKQS